MTHPETKITQFFAVVAKAFEQRILFAWSAEKWEALSYLAGIDRALVHRYWDVFGTNFKLKTIDFGYFHPNRRAAKCVTANYTWTIDEVAHEIKVCIVDKKVGYIEFSSLMILMKLEANNTDYSEMFDDEIRNLPDVVDFP